MQVTEFLQITITVFINISAECWLLNSGSLIVVFLR